MSTIFPIIDKIERDVEIMLLRYDLNEDKRLTRKEVIESLKQDKVEDPEISAGLIFKSIDVNKDDIISISEIRANLNKLNKKNLEEAIAHDLKEFFENHDQNNDKKITLGELVEGLVRAENYDKETAKKIAELIFKAKDTDNDGVLTVGELEKHFRAIASEYL
ncbi:hypothetical protein DICPUDRAFT_92112 [Dictyostelium purpureum]|uniref:EF-hand domain-containing protein n=1 Tax=Dictyostelium purpureum TaxID=5786 RepID=F0ZM81_DICPU|nr:uncharacterized protein DICPUDRAFT_92112 [Dictyostelium purpureum]EGC34949.1 hypothetical protein DICPUDRAFT_92112 [Dictyostelium purpureum]|eukprot:XP_003288530.1 hypothetical protein DICPUDRAFT_92112 [Dictyostelium purpureum]